MSLDLYDFRGKFTLETKCALRAVNKITGQDESAIARKVMHEWALQKIKEAKVMEALMRREGISGSERDDDEDPE